MSIYAWIIISTIVISMVAILVVKILTRPLPEWNGLYGEKYLKWKKEKNKNN